MSGDGEGWGIHGPWQPRLDLWRQSPGDGRRQCGAGCGVGRRISGTGSPNRWVAEDDPIDLPISPYATTKRAGELLCFNYHHLYGLKTSCLRFFTVYGPAQRPEMAIHKFTDLLARGEKIPLFGDGDSRRDYTYVEDIVDGILAALDLAPGFEIVNLGGAETTRLGDLVT